MNKLRDLIIVMVLLTGTGFAAYNAGIINKPSFGVQDRGDWKNVTDSSIQIQTTAWINNENPAGIKLSQSEISYNLKMNGVKLAHGNKKGINIEKGNQTVSITTSLLQKNIQSWWVTHMKNNEKSNLVVPIDLYLKLGPIPLNLNEIKYTDTIQTDIESILDSSAAQINGKYTGPSLALESNGFSEQSRPEIRITDTEARFGKVNQKRTELVFETSIENLNEYPIPVPEFKGDIRMNDVTVSDWRANNYRASDVGDEAVISPGETEDIKFKADLDNTKIDDWLTTHVRKDEQSNGQVEIKLVFNVGDTEFTIPQGEGLKCSFSFQTGILEDNQQTSPDFGGCRSPYSTSLSDGGNQGSGSGYNSDDSGGGFR
jgi:LEA14-like dessication related protein